MFILGSSSPRRIEIMNFFKIPYIRVRPSFDEESIPFKGDPGKYVEDIAEGKAKSIFAERQDLPIVTCDTTVYHRGNVLNKPKDEAEALAMLRSLEGSYHEVYSGLCGITCEGKIFHIHEVTKVRFRSVGGEALMKYHHAIHSHDKAGGYAIQGSGSLIVERIEGCYYNVMGLPLQGLNTILEDLGFSLWDYLKRS